MWRSVSARSRSGSKPVGSASGIASHVVDPVADQSPASTRVELQAPGALAEPEGLEADARCGERDGARRQVEAVVVPLERHEPLRAGREDRVVLRLPGAARRRTSRSRARPPAIDRRLRRLRDQLAAEADPEQRHPAVEEPLDEQRSPRAATDGRPPRACSSRRRRASRRRTRRAGAGAASPRRGSTPRACRPRSAALSAKTPAARRRLVDQREDRASPASLRATSASRRPRRPERRLEGPRRGVPGAPSPIGRPSSSTTGMISRTDEEVNASSAGRERREREPALLDRVAERPPAAASTCERVTPARMPSSSVGV